MLCRLSDPFPVFGPASHPDLKTMKLDEVLQDGPSLANGKYVCVSKKGAPRVLLARILTHELLDARRIMHHH